jgi:ATP/maltotriose-dependent transcriptional regulator MalT
VSISPDIITTFRCRIQQRQGPEHGEQQARPIYHRKRDSIEATSRWCSPLSPSAGGSRSRQAGRSGNSSRPTAAIAEIRKPDLRFTVAEAAELLAAAGVDLPDPGLRVQRTEGWAAGMRLAVLSLAGHPDPGRFAEQFSGTERTVAEYLLAEVLNRQPERVLRLLLRTSILERVNGELADLLTGGERVLQGLEAAGAFVV